MNGSETGGSPRRSAADRTRPHGWRSIAPTALLLLLLALAPDRAAAGTAPALVVGAPQALPSGVAAASIACSDAHTCYVAGDVPTGVQGAFAAANAGVLLTLSDGSVSAQQPLERPGPVAIACSSGGCYVTEKPGPNPAGILAVVNGVPGGLQSAAVDQLNGIACAADGTCYAAGQRNGTNGSAGVIVPVANSQVGQSITVPGTDWLNDIDCPATTTCYAAGALASAPVIATFANGQPGSVAPVAGGPGDLKLAAIACPGGDVCYAAGSGGGSGVLVPVQDGRPGPAQSIAGVSSFSALACPTSNVCLALGGESISSAASTASQQPVIVPVVDGVPGAAVAVSGAGSGSLLSGDCPTGRVCYAVSSSAVVAIAWTGG